jgi:hypothetical protein
MPKSKLNVQDEIPGTDTPLSRLCDQFLEERGEVEVARKAFQSTEKQLLQEMQQAGKKSIKHGGVTIRHVHQEEKDKVQVVSAE